MKCKDCEAYGDYGCRAGFTSIVINGELGCKDADRALDAFHFNQVKDKTVASTHTHADSTRAMTDEEFAEWVSDIASCRHCPIAKENACSGGLHVSYAYCKERWLGWLRQEATE